MQSGDVLEVGTGFVRLRDQRRQAENNEKNKSSALPPSIDKVPKMADIVTSLNLSCFLLSFLG